VFLNAGDGRGRTAHSKDCDENYPNNPSKFWARWMLARPGEVVSREVLREAAWPSDTFVDFDPDEKPR